VKSTSPKYQLAVNHVAGLAAHKFYIKLLH